MCIRDSIKDDQGMTTPLRLSPAEASALLILLDSLETMPGLVDGRAVRSAAEKIRAVTTSQAVGDAEHTAEAGVASTVAEALAAKRKLRITYYSASSDTVSEREVDPASLFHQSGATYLRATDSGETKTFRLDRIQQAELLDVPSETPGTDFDPADPFGMADQPQAKLLIHKDATWLADYWDIELEDAQAQGEWLPATMRYGSDSWLVRFSLSQADRVRIVEPAGLAAEAMSSAKCALDALD